MIHGYSVVFDGSDFAMSFLRTIDRGVARNLNSLRNLLPGNQRNDPVIVSAKASDYVQMLIDDRMLLTDLSIDDPARIADPALPHFFWARVVAPDQLGSGGNAVDVYRPIVLVGGVATHIISREVLVTVTWNGLIAPNAVHLAVENPRRFR